MFINRGHIFKAVLVVVSVLCFVLTSTRAREATSLPDSFVRTPPLVDIPERYVSMMFLGFRNTYENFLAIWTTHYLVSPTVEKYDLDQLEKMFKKVASMKHRREYLYMLSCYVIANLKRPEACVDIITAGMERLPESWRLPLVLGSIYMEDLDDPIKAAIYYKVCSEREHSPDYIKNVARKLAEQGGTTLDSLERSVADVLGIPEDSDLYKIIKRRYKEDTEEDEQIANDNAADDDNDSEQLEYEQDTVEQATEGL
ncbi:MAG: hypothetical protein OYH77_06140 [Pseudomonadota bacterium]|nr:hypothetical protein [Pseudomonadota bacterium]